MLIKHIMQLISTIQKIEYDFVPVWIAQTVPIRTPHYIPRYFSTPKSSILYNDLLVYQMFDDYMLISESFNLNLGIRKQI